MAASLLHAAPLQNLTQPTARAALHPLASAPPLRLPRPSLPSRRHLEVSLPAAHRFAGRGAPRGRRAVAGEETGGSEVGDDKDSSKGEMKPVEAQEAWKVMLEHFKAEALSMQANDVYSKRTTEVLLEASEKLKMIQADKAQKDLSAKATEVGQEGQEYLMMAAQNFPDSIKDITMTFKALGSLNWPSEYEDYHVAIPFGTFLTVGGLLNFMLTRRTSAIRFGVALFSLLALGISSLRSDIVLGFALLALGISSLRSHRKGGRRPRLLLKGQAAIATFIFFREFSVLLLLNFLGVTVGWFPKIFMVLLSGMVAAFYFYRIATGSPKDLSSKSDSAN